ncbi:hypothetical protein [Streptomyces sp. NPDC097610]|uniref:hypothetical protein n=1 Tax=Streptomyces sp. NPDC097610 TaxID=3157227 RepID=UPI00332596F2
MRSASELLGWNIPFDQNALPREWVERLPIPGAGIVDRIHALEQFEEAASRGPLHLHLLGVAQLLAGQPFLAVRSLGNTVGANPQHRAARADLATAYAYTERLDMARVVLAKLVDAVTAETVPALAALGGPESLRYPHDSPQAVAACRRFNDLGALVGRRKREETFLLLRTADDAQARSEAPRLSVDQSLRHAISLMELGELADVVHPFDQATEILLAHYPVLESEQWEQLARILVAAGPRSDRDKALGYLKEAAPQSQVLRQHHQPSMLERRLLEQDAHFEAQLLALEVANGVRDWSDLRRPIEQLVRRARASDYPEPYQAALAKAGVVPNEGAHHFR